MTAKPQGLKNHVRWVPLYHGVLALLYFVLLSHAVRGMIAKPASEAGWEFGLVLALGLTAYFARAFALAAQDRVIRLEMRLRLHALAPDLVPGFLALPSPLQVALRFAGDAEVAGLVREAIAGRLTSAGAIKARITDWQADWMRV